MAFSQVLKDMTLQHFSSMVGPVVAVDVDEVNYIMSQKRPPPYIHCIYIYNYEIHRSV